MVFLVHQKWKNDQMIQMIMIILTVNQMDKVLPILSKMTILLRTRNLGRNQNLRKCLLPIGPENKVNVIAPKTWRSSNRVSNSRILAQILLIHQKVTPRIIAIQFLVTRLARNRAMNHNRNPKVEMLQLKNS